MFNHHHLFIKDIIEEEMLRAYRRISGNECIRKQMATARPHGLPNPFNALYLWGSWHFKNELHSLAVEAEWNLCVQQNQIKHKRLNTLQTSLLMMRTEKNVGDVLNVLESSKDYFHVTFIPRLLPQRYQIFALLCRASSQRIIHRISRSRSDSLCSD